MFWGWGKLPNAIVTKLLNENIQNYQLEMIDSGGGKLPIANCDQTTKWKYPKLPTRNVQFWWGKLPNANCDQTTKWKYPNYQLEMFDSGGSVNYQMQLWPTTKWKYPKLPYRNVWFWGVSKLPNANCDQTTKWKYPKLTTRNVWFSGGSVNYQMQIVTKLPNENIQNYQLEMFEFRGGEKLPNANCNQTTKWKYPKLPTRNVQFWRGGVNYQMQIVTKLPNENIQNYQLECLILMGLMAQ